MTIKPGVSITGLRPEALLGLMVVDAVFANHLEEMELTSCTEGVHSAGSLHYVGQAFDVGIRMMSKDPAILTEKCRDALGAEFDVVLEKDHIHIEFQPKRNRT